MAHPKKKATVSKRAEDALEGRKWYIVDATDQVVGRLATRVASVLRGKHHADYTPHVDCGDFVIVLNAGRARFTGSKPEKKIYHHHTGWVGGVRSQTAAAMFKSRPVVPLTLAIRGMLPKGALGRRMSRKLKIYAGATHPHTAQKAEPLAALLGAS